MKVLLVTSWNTPHHCGIEAHSRQLLGAVRAADPSIEITPSAEVLDPEVRGYKPYDLIHLNYHAGLHSRWTPEWVRRIQQSYNKKVVITYHDTGVPNSTQCLDLYRDADAFIVHEPCADLPNAYYWRQGVPVHDGRHGHRSALHRIGPVLGTVGHDFPWKNFDLLATETATAGWGLVICTPAMTVEREEQLRGLNPRLTVFRDFGDEDTLATLAECDATAFLYVTHNTGTSGAIRQGIAAKKPILAFSTCRQFRDLYEDGTLGRHAIWWCDTVDSLRQRLRWMTLGRFDPGVAQLAERDSWVHLGRRYAALYRSLVQKEDPVAVQEG
jgi:hypothetical protein